VRSLLPVLLLLSACSAVKNYRLADDWETKDKNALKRIVIVVQPLPDANEKVAAMMARVARRYVHMKRNFLVKADVARTQRLDLTAECTEAQVDGVLWLEPAVKALGDGIEANVKGKLLRCSDGVEVWAAEAGGSYKSYDEGLKEVAANYGRENGAEVERYVPATMHVLRPMLDTLPQPELTEADVEEKMSLDE
jgi:probable lipoprotein (TIGR04455 family)